MNHVVLPPAEPKYRTLERLALGLCALAEVILLPEVALRLML